MGLFMLDSTMSKTCSKCNQTKDIADFGKRSDTKDGYKTICKPCSNIAFRNWAKTDKSIEYQKNWKKENPEKVKSYSDNYWSKNPDKLKEKRSRSTKKWRSKFPEKANEKARKWRKANPEKVKEINKRHRANNPNKPRDDARARRARLKQVPFEKLTEQQIFDRWGTNCHLCKLPIDLNAPRQPGKAGWENGLHLEHVIRIADGGSDTLENIKPAHGLCNLKKN
jgi:hypothetical protein